MNQEQCVGFIQLTFFDDVSGEAVTMGGAGFVTVQEVDAAWANVAPFDGESSFMADRLDAERDIIDDRTVSAETYEALMGKPIAELIANGRAQLAAELASYGMAA